MPEPWRRPAGSSAPNYRPVLRSYADFATLPGSLGERGLSEPDEERILGANALRLLQAVVG